MKMDPTAARIERAREVMQKHGPSHDWQNDDTVMATPDRYLLVEFGTNVSPVWYTTWATPEDAGWYWLNQEDRKDWEIGELVDLDTGERFTGEPGPVVWEQYQGADSA